MNATGGWRWPAEWEAQDGVLLAWPHPDTDWAANLADVERTYVALAGAIARFEWVVIGVASPALETHARQLLVRAHATLDRIRFVALDYDDTWLRDSGPVTLTDGRRFRLLDFRFTGWGGKFESGRDDRLIEQLLDAGVFRDASRTRVDFALEGGAIESDGEGTVLTTLRCLRQRHPTLSRGELAEALENHLAADRVLILEHGALEGDDTDAHIDTLARFAPDASIVFQACDRVDDSHYVELRRMREELATLRTRDGRPYRLIALPWARPIRAADGRRLAASYANYLIVNDAVLMPAYGDSADSHAMHVLARAHPGREVIPVPCRALIEQNGSLHCVTMQMPRGSLREF
jgi:agmatine/peptidylarginine deiminase